MTIEEFKTELEKWVTKCWGEDELRRFGFDLSVNTDFTVGPDGFIYVNAYESFKRYKTCVNVANVVEFRRDAYFKGSFYIICNDMTGFEFGDDNDFYYCIDGKPSGWGPAAHHFEKFPDGDSRAETERVEREFMKS